VTQKRLDIQGLRALAVILVVAFHLWPAQVTGGYVGVDVFFVISGFLITAHLVSEVDRTGGVKLTEFWAKRIRRLLPAAFTVLAVSAAAAMALMPKALWQQTLYEIGASALYVQNWVLAGSSVNYLDAQNAPTVVQHFWSLSVEEQFYVVWPLIILGAVLLAARVGRSTMNSRWFIGASLLLVFIASLAFSIYETSHSQPSAYFVTPTRAWEFAAGGLLVFLPALKANVVPVRIRGAALVVAGWVGLSLILYSAMYFNSETPFPGSAALMPVTGAMVLIYVGMHQSRWSVGYLAGFGPAQFLGEISYSLYLWHWPLIILYPFVSGSELGIRSSLLVLFASVVLAWGTKLLIEDPFRTKSRFSGRGPAYRLAVAGMAIFLVVSVTGSIYVGALHSQATSSEHTAYTANGLSAEIEITLDAPEWAFPDQLAGRNAIAPEWGNDDCLNADVYDIDRCTYGDSGAEFTAVVVGDSAGTSYLGAIRGALQGHGWKIIPLTLEQCPASDIPVTMAGVRQEYALCVEHRLLVETLVPNLNADLIIFVSAGNSSYGRLLNRATGSQADKEWAAGIESFTKKFVAKGTDLVVLGDIVKANCVTTFGKAPNACVGDGAPAEAGRINAEKYGAEAAGARYIDSRPWTCGRDFRICPEQIGSALVRADGSHLTGSFSTRLRGIMRAALIQ
jgi:peptidoglycan/LPS O-acetylase OafA/YrhL